MGLKIKARIKATIIAIRTGFKRKKDKTARAIRIKTLTAFLK